MLTLQAAYQALEQRVSVLEYQFHQLRQVLRTL